MKAKQQSLASMFKPKMNGNDSKGNGVKTEKYMPSRPVEKTNRLTYDDNEGMSSYGLNSYNTSKWERSGSFMKEPPGKFTNGFVPNRVAGEEPEENNACRPSLDPKYDEHIKLSASQKYVLDLIMQRKSVFFTGAAGTGKSFILRVLSDIMDKLGKADRIAFTASTGVAACNIRGLTVHSWAGLAVSKPGDTEADVVGASLRSGPARMRWKNTDILVIDEISMISNETLEILSIIGKRHRNDNRPFGGIQLVLCGDFFQLPPVAKGNNIKYCFEAASWKQLFEMNRDDGIVVLDVVFRQKEDTLFLNMLNEMRKGIVTERTRQVLHQKAQETKQMKILEGQKAETDDEEIEIRPTKLFSTNKDVDKYNLTELKRLADADAESEVHKFLAFDSGTEPYLKQLIQGTKAPQELELRVGAQVMLLKNLSVEDGLVNGSRGTVIRFEPSRGRSNKFRYLPVVKFMVTLGSDISSETVVIKEEDFSIKVGNEEKAVRIQLPLMLAWALSIHKSQGMTIPLLEVSFNRIFECGQAYVALSRATSLKGLTLVDYNSQCIRANPEVVKFYETRSRAAKGGAGGGFTSDMVTTSVTALSETYLGETPPPPPPADDGWMENKREQMAAAAAMRAETDAAIRHSIIVSQNDCGESSAPLNPYKMSRAEMIKQEASMKDANPFRAYQYDDWLEKKMPTFNASTGQPYPGKSDPGPFSAASATAKVSGVKREWSEVSNGDDKPIDLSYERLSGPFTVTNTPEPSMVNLVSADSTTSTESSPSVYDLTQDMEEDQRQPQTKSEPVVETVKQEVEEPHYFTRPVQRPSFSTTPQRSSSFGSSGSGSATNSSGYSFNAGGGVAYGNSFKKPLLFPTSSGDATTLPPRPSSASKASTSGVRPALTLGSFIEPLRKAKPTVNSVMSSSGASSSQSPGYASTSNSGGFTGGFNPYAPTKNVVKIKDMQSTAYKTSSGPAVGKSGGSGYPVAASTAPKTELTEEQKQRIEANRQAALKKLAESKLRREEELQKARAAYVV